MPKEVKKQARVPLRVEPIRPGETWKQYIDRLRSSPALGAAQAAGIMAATVLMGKNPNGPANGRMTEALVQRLAKQPSFRSLIRDPEALSLARSGKGAELIVRMRDYQQREELARRKYQRDPSMVRDDAVFLQAAMKSMKDSFASRSAAQRERESRRFVEMMKRMDHARSLAEQGIAMDGKTARELAQAVQYYNDGGGKTPGGKQQAAASKEALCVLNRLMPAEDYQDYCSSINRAHQAESPTHRRHVNPSDYTQALLNGSARTARDVMTASQKRLARGMTLDGCAMVTAVLRLSGGNPNAIIRRDKLEAEVKRLKTPGSAFLRAMSDDAARARYGEIAAKGDAVKLGRAILHDAKAHSVRSAQWQINQSASSAAKDGSGVSVEKLATILAAREMAVNANAAQRITHGAFKQKADEIRSSSSFAALAAQYRKDPAMRNRINQGLTNGDGGKALETEFEKVRSPKQKELDVPVRKAPDKG